MNDTPTTADGHKIKPGLPVWILWGGIAYNATPRRRSRLRRAEVTRITRTGKIRLAWIDPLPNSTSGCTRAPKHLYYEHAAAIPAAEKAAEVFCASVQ